MKHILFALLLTYSSATFCQSYTETQHLSLGEVELLGAEYGLPSALFSPVSSVQAFQMTYNMPFQGDTIEVSGAVFVPMDMAVDCANPVHMYAHGTVFERMNTPSFLNYEGELGFLMAGLGFTVLMPDYVGLGTDTQHLHPYVHAESEAQAGVSMLDALFNAPPIGSHDASQIFLSGYSQGGHAAMATHQLIEAEHPEYTVVAAAPGSGPYDISGTQFPWTFADVSYSNPAYLAYVALAWQSIYGDLYSDLNEYFQEPYASQLPGLFDGNTSGADINNALPTLTADFAQPGLLDALLQPGSSFLVAAEDNDVYNWGPTAPTRLYYCTEDEQVYYENALMAEAAMQAAGASDVSAINLGAYDHNGCAGQAIFGATLWFSSLATICELSSTSELEIQGAHIVPNPASDQLKWPGLTSTDEWTAMDINGREIAKGIGSNIQVSNWPNGIYMLRSSEKAQRVIVAH